MFTTLPAAPSVLATMGVLMQTSCLSFYDQCLLYSNKSIWWSRAAAKTFCMFKLMSPLARVSLTLGNSAKRLVVDMLFSAVALLNRSFMSTQPPLQRACRVESWAGRAGDKAEFLTYSQAWSCFIVVMATGPTCLQSLLYEKNDAVSSLTAEYINQISLPCLYLFCGSQWKK